MRQTEPYSPWQQAAEGCIRELKRGGRVEHHCEGGGGKSDLLSRE